MKNYNIKDYSELDFPSNEPEVYQESDGHIDDCPDIEERIAEQERNKPKNEQLRSLFLANLP